MKLILIRHGMTAANEKHLYCGSTDLPLSIFGRLSLERLKGEKTYPDISNMRLITSGMKRCDETSSLLFGGVPFDIDPDLREMDFGAFEMRSYEELRDDPDYRIWITGDNEANLAPGGESGAIMARRVIRALDRISASQRDTAIVAHGGVIACIMSHLFPGEGKNRYQWQPPPGGGYVADLELDTYWEI